LTGPTGPKGANGADGANGANGADGAVGPGFTTISGTIGTSNILTANGANAAIGQRLLTVDNLGLNLNNTGIRNTSSLSLYNSTGTWTQVASSLNWNGIASSADGTKLSAVAYGGYIWTSTDSGATWSQSQSASTNWSGIASSADATKQVAVASLGVIYVSENSGTNWSQRAPFYTPQPYSSVACSSDGTKIFVTIQGASIWRSTNSGIDWTQAYSNTVQFNGIACSADGTKICVTAANNYTWTSVDSGNSWTRGDLLLNWRGVASSSDGTKVAAVVDGGYIYVSTTSGTTWTQSTTDTTRTWRAITSSSDGTRLAAVVDGGYVYISTDSGATWTQSTTDTTRTWRAITSSSDGIKLAAVPYGGYIYTSGLQTISVSSDSKNNLTLVPSSGKNIRLQAPTEWRYITTTISGTSVDLTAATSYYGTTHRLTGASCAITFPALSTTTAGVWWTFINGYTAPQSLSWSATITGRISPYVLPVGAWVTFYSDGTSYYLTTGGLTATGATGTTNVLTANGANAAAGQTNLIFNGTDVLTVSNTSTSYNTNITVIGATGGQIWMGVPGATNNFVYAAAAGDSIIRGTAKLHLASGASGNAAVNYLPGITVSNVSVGINNSAPTYTLDVSGGGRFTSSVLATDFVASSDRRLKTEITTISNALDIVKELRGVYFTRNGEATRSVGVVAQEVEMILPEVVHTGVDGMRAVSYGNIAGVLIEAIKTLSEKLEKISR